MVKEYLTIKENLDIIKERINESCKKSKREDKVILLGATKMNSADKINYAIGEGLEYIGENKVQELLEKYDQIDKDRVTIHFIGHLQSNKVKYIIDKVDMIQSLDSISLAKEIDKQAKKHGLVMKVLVEINAGMEESKSGVAPEEVENFVKEVSCFENIQVMGLMAIPPIMTSEEEQRKIFKEIYKIFVDISSKSIHNIDMRYLSLGMSDDYPIAVEEGANIVRVGSALFGTRNHKK
ncbi:MAG: YggS family pyridoxal phosphate-dependent enzyme [Ruminococcaceae bacterium]|nr:YggS family pyridoxal phosphate-dependent enzyme [Oscillospiraceae bacterium]